MELGKQTLIDLYTRMLTIRRFEERVVKEYYSGKIVGFVHSYIGEEAIATGVCAHLNKTVRCIPETEEEKFQELVDTRTDVMKEVETVNVVEAEKNTAEIVVEPMIVEPIIEEPKIEEPLVKAPKLPCEVCGSKIKRHKKTCTK